MLQGVRRVTIIFGVLFLCLPMMAQRGGRGAGTAAAPNEGRGQGGQLAVLLGTTADVSTLEGDEGNPGQSSQVQAVVDVAGPMTTGALNPVEYVTKDDAPTLILHGTSDTEVSTRQSQRAQAGAAIDPGASTSWCAPEFLASHVTSLSIGIAVAPLITSPAMKIATSQRMRRSERRCSMVSITASPSIK